LNLEEDNLIADHKIIYVAECSDAFVSGVVETIQKFREIKFWDQFPKVSTLQ
jgi:hypothetical protein